MERKKTINKKTKKNGNKEIEHPKPLLEVMENTASTVETFAMAKGISDTEAALILILNELRCIHWHYDQQLEKENERT